MKLNHLIAAACAALVVCAWWAQQVVTEVEKVGDDDAALRAFRAQVEAKNPGLEVVEVEADLIKRAVLAPRPPPAAQPKIAIFVKNQTRVRALDEEVDGVRDRISAELAGSGMIIMDAQDIASSFNRFKVTTAEERAGLIDGVFTGGAVLRVAQMLGCDYIMLVSIIGADEQNRTAGDLPTTVFTLRMTTKVLEAAEGSTVYGSNATERLPVPSAGVAKGNELPYYSDLIDQWSQKTGREITTKAPTWRRAAPADVQMAGFSVSTTIDEFIGGLENGVREPNELLGEMRRIIGGVTVELDGAAIGSSPGTFTAAPGLHQLRITRQWMKPWQQTVAIQQGAKFRVGLELSDEGLRKFKDLEGFRAGLAVAYAEAVLRKGIRINFDTAQWRDVGNRGNDINVQNVNQQ